MSKLDHFSIDDGNITDKGLVHLRNHVIVAEGFALEELEAKIKEAAL